MLLMADSPGGLDLGVAEELSGGLVELREPVEITLVKSDEDRRLLAGMDRKPSLEVCRWVGSRCWCCCGCSS